jgi:hypothetical protein
MIIIRNIWRLVEGSRHGKISTERTLVAKNDGTAHSAGSGSTQAVSVIAFRGSRARTDTKPRVPAIPR